MNPLFLPLFEKPYLDDHGVFRFGGQSEGDHFDASDVALWKNGGFARNWESRSFLNHAASRRLVDCIVEREPYVIELACGPGMGLIPSVKKIDPRFPCLATDANDDVLREWNRYLNDQNVDSLDFAQFSLFDIPLKSGAVRAYSSFIGISSTRNGEDGYADALSQIRRTLSGDGRLYTIEGEYSDIPKILGLFEKSGMTPWSCFLGEQLTWHDRLIKNGFEILYEEPFESRKIKEDDNELGEAAVKYGVDVEMKFTAFVLKKR